jgi:CRP/FNR family cyclic AMP-dependent transcriptional regulator
VSTTQACGPALTPDQGRSLAGSDLLQDLPRSAVDDLLARLRVTVLPEGAALFAPGEVGRRLWLVIDGRVGVLVHRPTRLLAVLGAGDAIGEVQVFDPAPWTFSATAMTRAVVASADREDVLAWVARHPAVSAHLLRRSGRRLASKSRAGGGPHHTEATVRVAQELLALADRYTVDGVVRHGLTQQQLADIVGLSRERINKSLGCFTEVGWLALGRGSFRLLDRAALEAHVVAAQASPPQAPAGHTVDLREECEARSLTPSTGGST